MKKICLQLLAALGVFAAVIILNNVEASANAGFFGQIKDCLKPYEGLVVSSYDVAISKASLEEEKPKIEIPDESDKDADNKAVTVDPETGKKRYYGYKRLGIAHVDSYLNVRKSASESGEIVGKMPPGAGCEILGVEGDWYEIKSGNVTGFVSNEFLVTGDDAVNMASTYEKTIATVNTTTLFVRSEPNTDCTILTMVPITEELTVTDLLDGWCEIELDDETGYVSADYVNVSLELPKAMTLKELKKGQGISDTRVDLVAFALKYVGNKYVWGGESLTNGVDCSGFTMKVYANFGVSLPHSSRSQANYGTKVNASDAKPGDLFFYGSGGRINHVAIYIGNSQIVHASNSRDGIKISNCYYRTPLRVISLLS